MFNHNDLYIAPCGINCSVCMAFLREKNKCPGCRGSDLKKPKTRVDCKIKTCPVFKEKGITFCFECEQFPCAVLKHLDKRYRTKYNMSPIENQQNMKEMGMESFLQNEKERWLCANCGGTICVHTGVCANCKKSRE